MVIIVVENILPAYTNTMFVIKPSMTFVTKYSKEFSRKVSNIYLFAENGQCPLLHDYFI